ncbi:MAG: DUF2993 domain-containing protein [Ilumatobacteraceae bacterium]
MSGDSGIQWTSIDAPKSIPPRWRWIGFVIALAVVGALVAFALIEGDKIVRGIASDVVKSGVSSALQLPEGQEVDVDMGEGLLVFQAVTGSIDSVDVTIPGVAFGGAVGTLALTVEGVSLDPSAPVGTLVARMVLDSANLGAFAGNLSAVPLTSVAIGDGVVGINADLAGQPVTVGLVPTVTGGAVSFAPTTVTVAGTAMTVEEVMASPLAPLAGPMLTSSAVCLGPYLPKSVAVTGAEVVGETLVVTASGDDVRLTGIGTKGTCEAPAA